jgi:hypothetical protein
MLIASCAIATALAAIALAWLDVEMFDSLAREDSIVEWSSALFLFGGAVVMLAAAFAFDFRQAPLAFAAALGFGILLLWIGLEEVSWFQRVWNITTPEWLSEANAQHEMNFHNLATETMENAYYMGGFVFLVLVPFLAHTHSPASDWFINFVPGRHIVVVGAMATAFSYDMWNIFWFPLSTFLAVLVLMAYGVSAACNRRSLECWLFLIAAAALVTVTVVDLKTGATFPRRHADREYKELFIAMGLALAALGAASWIRMKKKAASVLDGAVPYPASAE